MSAVSFFRSVTFALIFMLFVFGNLPAQDWGDVEDWEWYLYPPSEISDEPAMVIFDKGEMKVDLSGISLIRHVRIKVFDKDNIDDVASIDISYYDGDKFSKFKAHTILPNGDKKKVKDKFEKKAGDLKTLTFTFPAIKDGVILEYQYQIFHQRFSILEPWYFQNEIYTLKSIFSVTLYPGFTYNARGTNLPLDKQQPQAEDIRVFDVEMKKFTWELDSLMPAKAEPLAGSVTNYMAGLYFQLIEFNDGRKRVSFLNSWDEVGGRISELFVDFINNQDEIEELADMLTANAVSDDEKIRCLYDFVRDSIGTRGGGLYDFLDCKCSDLLKDKYGPPTTKNLLLTALLQQSGFKAYPLLIGTRGFCNFNPSLVQISQFNHLICYVDLGGGEYILDTGEKAVAFPYVPAYDLIEKGLLVDGAASRPISLMPPPDRTSSTQLSGIINLREDGSAICSTFICVQGYENAKYDAYLIDTVSQQQIAEGLMEKLEHNYQVHEALTTYYPEGDSLSMKLVLEFPEFCTKLGENMLVSPCLLPLVDNPFESEKRQFPIDFQYEYTVSHNIVINLPEKIEVADLPVAINKVENCGKYIRTCLASGNSISVMAYFKLNKATFLPLEYPDLKGMFDEITETSQDQIALIMQE